MYIDAIDENECYKTSFFSHNTGHLNGREVIVMDKKSEKNAHMNAVKENIYKPTMTRISVEVDSKGNYIVKGTMEFDLGSKDDTNNNKDNNSSSSSQSDNSQNTEAAAPDSSDPR